MGFLKSHPLVFLLMLLSASQIRTEDFEDNRIQESDESRSFSDLDLDILGSDYFDDDSIGSSTKVQIGDPDPTPVEEPLVVKKVAPCLGCPTAINTENPKIKEIASFAFESYLDSDEGQQGDAAQSFVRVIKAETQIVAGVKYILEVELGLLNCTTTQFQTNPTDCVLDPTKNTFICNFHVVEKSWLNNKEVVQSKCHRESTTTTDTLIEESPLEQDEAGNDEVDFVAPTGDDDAAEEPVLTRRKRDTAEVSTDSNLGKIKETEEDPANLREMAVFAVEQLDRVDEDTQARLVLDVVTARKQTVSGWLYHLKVRVAQTTCEEGSVVTFEACKDKFILPFQLCDIKVLFQPWQTVQKKVVQSQCYPESYKKSKRLAKKLFKEAETDRTKRQKIGGPKVIDPNTEDISELVNFAIDSVDAQSNALHAQKLVRVVYAERQFVSGIRTKVVLEVGYTECRKSPALDKSQCSIDETRDHQYCSITVVEKPWLKEKKMTGSKCGTQAEVLSPRHKRSLPTPTFENEEQEGLFEFGKFVDKYQKKYSSAEETALRFQVFKENMRKVKLLQETEQGSATYGATIFADLTEEEFAQRHLGLRTDLRTRMKRKQAKIPQLAKIPDEFDWRHYNAVTPVKQQGLCGSCWAFSVTGNIEGAYKIKHGDLLSLSEQELVDCDTLDEGCNGGLPENAYKAIEKLGGLESETDYHYDGVGEKCQFKRELVKAQVTGFVEISKNETDMQAWLLKNGPISIGINANAMQFYFGGVSHPWKYLCSPKNLDHGVLIVGYGVHTTSFRHKTLPYWIVKNSWGPGWGEQGYYRVYRGDGTCGLNQMASSAQVA